MSRACDVTGAFAPFTLEGRVLSAVADNTAASQLVNVSVSPAATWRLYGNKACTSELADKTVSLPQEGLHRAYVKVTCESGRHSKVYPVLVYRLGSEDPAVVAYDPNYNELSDNAVVKSDVRVKTLGSAPLTPSVNGGATKWPSGGIFTATGVYEIVLTDGNGAAADICFTIDKTAPVITAKDTAKATIANGAWAKNAVKITIADLTAVTKAAKKNGAALAWPAGDTFSADGSYYVEATDVMGNKSSYSFTIDRTMPVVLAKCGKTVLSNNAYVKLSVVVTVSDANYTGKSVTKNGAAMKWPSNNKFSSAAAYVVTVTDRGGNATVFRFTIDNTAPKITAKAGKSTIRNKGKTKYDVTLTIKEANIASKTITMGGAAITWPANNILTAEGYYVVNVTDKTGSKATLSFTIDKKPVVTLRTVSGKTLANKAVTGESVNITVTDKFLSSKTLKRSGKTVKWPSNNQVTSDGSYTLYVKDKIKNKVTIAFIIDKSAPKITAKAKKTVANGGAVKDSRVTVSISDLISFTKSATLNGKAVSWPSKGRFTAEGVYTITARDSLSHSSTFTFIIDRSKPVVTCKTASTSRNVTNGMTVNENVIVTITDRVRVTPTVTRNGAAIALPSDRTLKDNGTYTIKAKDALGYTSPTLTFTINKASPAITARDSSNAAIANKGVTKNNVTVTATGAVQTTVTRNGASYAYPTGGVFSAEGAYVVTARDAAANTATFAFTIDRTAPAINAVDSSGTITNNGITNKNVTVTVTGATQTTATRNSAAYAYPSGGVFTAEGVYVVTARDAVGNTSTFTFTIDKTGPAVSAVNSDMADINSGDFTTMDVTVTVTGAEEIRVNEDSADGYDFPEGVIFCDEGRFVIEARDAAGNWTTFIFSIDKTPPAGISAQLLSDSTPITDDSTVTSSVMLAIINSSEPYDFASVMIEKDGAVYKKYPLSEGEDVSLLWDVDASPLIIDQIGSYEITVTDKAGNEYIFTFTLATE